MSKIMNLFQALIKKPLRWVASSVQGKKGRDLVDKYGPIIEEATTFFAPQLAVDISDMGKSIIVDWAVAKGVPVEDAQSIADVVIKRKS